MGGGGCENRTELTVRRDREIPLGISFPGRKISPWGEGSFRNLAVSLFVLLEIFGTVRN